ncbi:helix-turn-helix transcriptional regulator [Streptomyces spinosisporus]|jgi:transcriptional regulator with XRE-family HTH domain|uniref:Helix-turn-helix transcriptional regulator n=1 Tax=Streptomyces spinosisporus TaxID=2927582 RepID=A0ABS9XWC8_9ACTN|nr:helix-turn-helix transcriptional regulator [Streptomyces spinosisporus]MCI3246378.1 helix-turn-helix transcriptional regulator [Streptomyces spinosisporus]
MSTAYDDANEEFSEFLRTRRARISPGEAGVGTAGGPRRVPGLRREEVARLAGVSVDYYIRLERGRGTNVSDAVLEALARALRLDDTERAHLFTLAGPAHRRRRGRDGRSQALAVQRVRPGLLRVRDMIEAAPALVIGRRYDVLASNALARALYIDFEAQPVRKRNLVRFLFLDDAARKLYADWPTAARGVVAGLHLYAGRHPDDPLLRDLVAELSDRDRDFRRWWARHDVQDHGSGEKHYCHPVVGGMVLGYETLASITDDDQVLGMHTVEPGSPSEAALRRLAALADRRVDQGPTPPLSTTTRCTSRNAQQRTTD